MPQLLPLTAIACLLWIGNKTLSPPNGNAAKADEERPAFRPDMPLNTWVKVEPKYLPVPGGGRHRPQSWNKLVYDSIGKRLLYMDRWTDEEHGHSIYANAVHSGRGRYPFFFGFYDPDKNEWRKLDIPEAAPLPSPAWHTLAYDPAHDVYVRAAAEGGNPEWWLFRPDFSKADAVEREGISE